MRGLCAAGVAALALTATAAKSNAQSHVHAAVVGISPDGVRAALSAIADALPGVVAVLGVDKHNACALGKAAGTHSHVHALVLSDNAQSTRAALAEFRRCGGETSHGLVRPGGTPPADTLGLAPIAPTQYVHPPARDDLRPGAVVLVDARAPAGVAAGLRCLAGRAAAAHMAVASFPPSGRDSHDANGNAASSNAAYAGPGCPVSAARRALRRVCPGVLGVAALLSLITVLLLVSLCVRLSRRKSAPRAPAACAAPATGAV